MRGISTRRQMFREYASRISNYLDFVASGKDISEYHMTPVQRKDFIRCSALPDEVKKISGRGQLPLLIKLVEEGCRNNDIVALESKARASMMKDNPCYRQNYRKAKECLERLLEILGTDNSYTASSSCAGFAQLLGQIYYNGYLNKGEPQYAESGSCRNAPSRASGRTWRSAPTCASSPRRAATSSA